MAGDRVTVAGIGVSSPGRLVFEEPPVTKLQVAQHYLDWAARILPFARDRPISFLRCPDGAGAACFFQKHRSPGMADAIGTIAVQGRDEVEDYMTLSRAAGLVGAVQMGAVEFHIWGARNARLEQPDRLVFDLDPDTGLDFAEVRRAARDVRAVLDRAGLPSVPMLSGGKGIHVIVPLRPKAEWPAVKALSQAVASGMAAAEPGRFTATMSKAKREGRIFIDWLRNERGSTGVAPYGLRARAGAGVATPLDWDELDQVDRASAFDIHTVASRRDRDCPLRQATRRAVALGPQGLSRAEAAVREL